MSTGVHTYLQNSSLQRGAFRKAGSAGEEYETHIKESSHLKKESFTVIFKKVFFCCYSETMIIL